MLHRVRRFAGQAESEADARSPLGCQLAAQLTSRVGEFLIIDNDRARLHQNAVVIHRDEMQMSVLHPGGEGNKPDGPRSNRGRETWGEQPGHLEEVAILIVGKLVDRGYVTPSDHHAMPRSQRFSVKQDEAQFVLA